MTLQTLVLIPASMIREGDWSIFQLKWTSEILLEGALSISMKWNFIFLGENYQYLALTFIDAISMPINSSFE